MTAIQELAAFVESNEPRPVSYNVYLNENRTLMTVVQAHPDSASMEFHMNVAGPAFAALEELINLSTMDVFGKPSDHLLEQIQRARVSVHDLQAGLDRFGPPHRTRP